MKNKFLYYPIIIGIILLIIDQWSKVYVKTHFNLSEEVNVMGSWFKLHFLENYGMAFGIEFGGTSGGRGLSSFMSPFIVEIKLRSKQISPRRTIVGEPSWGSS